MGADWARELLENGERVDGGNQSAFEGGKEAGNS